MSSSLYKRPPNIPLEPLVPGTLLRYRGWRRPKDDPFGRELDPDSDFFGLVVWHKRYQRGDKRHVIGVVWDAGANETYKTYDNDLNGLVISVVQFP